MPKKSKIDKKLVINLYIKGLSYTEISKNLDINISTIKSCIQRNAHNEIYNRRNTLLQSIFSLYKEGYSFREISQKMQIHESTIKGIVYKNIPEEVEKRRVKRKLPKRLYFLSSDDIKELRERKRHMIYDHETIGVLSFLKWNRQSYLTTKKGSLKFDRKRGVPTHDTPHTYNYRVNGR